MNHMQYFSNIEVSLTIESLCASIPLDKSFPEVNHNLELIMPEPKEQLFLPLLT